MPIFLAALLSVAGAEAVFAGQCTQVSLPTGWYCEDVGNTPAAAYSMATATGSSPQDVFTVRGGGADNGDFYRGHEGSLHEEYPDNAGLIAGNFSDSFVFAYRPWSGDF
ncbi:MAG TPA: hypothetical protein VFD06_00770, partial [Candidatus Polarisedimenticolia bacterium]|nr:hypothetical protein [Candidatus Polarisedimenticolia bacterium]